jgi:hypothetical protein
MMRDRRPMTTRLALAFLAVGFLAGILLTALAGRH